MAPTAVILSAIIAILLALENARDAARREGINRTIEFITSRFPIESQMLDHLGAAEHKLARGTDQILTARSGRIDSDIDLAALERLVGSLSTDEKRALNMIAGYFETILVNVASGHFVKSIVDDHLGHAFGVQFWSRAWPYLVYTRLVSRIYGSLKGIPISETDMIFSAIERRMLSLGLGNPYPKYGESLRQAAQ